ncbi:MAG TPA: hypothetical protein VMW27_12225 [Thermoanaerobaculia bacterium]|nr:hypothetical protein [Thermoanaerobaculia bacterium]
MFTFKTLAWLVALNIATTVLHYVDNIVFFHEYPEPPWLTPGIVDVFWFFMTPVALTGLWLVRRDRRSMGSIVLLAYAGMSLLVLGHYRFAPFHTISWRIHAFIWLEAAAAIALVAWLLSAYFCRGLRMPRSGRS